MSVVIPFAPRTKVVAPASLSESPMQVAQILFFTGIRYERQVEPAPVEPQAARKRRAPATVRRGSGGQTV